MAQVKLEEDLKSAATEKRVTLEFKQEPENEGALSLEDSGSSLLSLKEEPEDVEIKAEPQIGPVPVKREGEGDREDAEDWAPSEKPPAPQTQSEETREEDSDSCASWEFNPPPAKTQTRTKRPMEDYTHSVQGRKYCTVPNNRPFKCSICDKCFLKKVHLRRHTDSHRGEYTWRCPVCREVFKHSGYLRLHMRKHTEGKVHQCAVCGKGFPRPSTLTLHMKAHGEHPARARERPFVCSDCPHSFVHPTGLSQHMKVAHPGNRQFSCPVCAKVFDKTTEMGPHLKTHKRKVIFKCPIFICSKRFDCPSKLMRHLRIHSGERPFACPHCPQRFAQGGTLKVHMKIHTRESSSDWTLMKPRDCGSLPQILPTHSSEPRFHCAPRSPEAGDKL